MTTPTTVLGLSNIQTEFGGANPIAISEYYGVNANVPGSGTLAMSKFLGISSGSGAIVQTKTLTAHGTYNANCATLHHSNGVCQLLPSGDVGTTGAGSYNWRLSGASADYEILAVKVSGSNLPTFSAGWANNTWIGLGSFRQVHLYSSAFGISTCTVNIKIRWTANGTVISSNNHSYTVESDK